MMLTSNTFEQQMYMKPYTCVDTRINVDVTLNTAITLLKGTPKSCRVCTT